MLAATPCSRSLASPARTTLMRLISVMGRSRRQWSTARSSRRTVNLICPRTPGNGHGRSGGIKGERAVTLDPKQSAALREKLLTEVGYITSSDLAGTWAREALIAKNSLIATDAKVVEDAFDRRLS